MRLIDADVAQSIADKELFIDEAGVVQFVLSHTPTIDAVPVVRCWDCGYYNNKGGYCIGLPGEPCVRRVPDDFCSHGERKGGE